MGLSPLHCGKYDYDSPDVPSPYVPPKYSIEVLHASYCKELDCSVAWLNYADYSRVMVLKGSTRYLFEFDPHFKENKSILARFPATKEGYETALAFVAFMNGVNVALIHCQVKTTHKLYRSLGK